MPDKGTTFILVLLGDLTGDLPIKTSTLRLTEANGRCCVLRALGLGAAPSCLEAVQKGTFIFLPPPEEVAAGQSTVVVAAYQIPKDYRHPLTLEFRSGKVPVRVNPVPAKLALPTTSNASPATNAAAGAASPGSGSTPPAPAPSPAMRTWTDNTGKYTVEAEFIELKDGKLHLKKQDGTSLAVAVERLSATNQQWLTMRQAAGRDPPASGQGLAVTAICGRGCEAPKGTCDVYILSEDEYHRYRKDQGMQLTAKGKTPLLLPGIEAGVYYVGVEAAIDDSLVPKRGGTPPQPMRPDYDAFFVDDLPDLTVHALRTGATPSQPGAYRVLWFWTKWYRCHIKDGRASSVRALFLPKDASPDRWQEVYPDTEHVTIACSERLQDEFWTRLRTTVGLSMSTQQQAVLTALLKRGGRVCVPGGRAPCVVSVDEDGQLRLGTRPDRPQLETGGGPAPAREASAAVDNVCRVRIADVTITPGKAELTLDLDWSKSAAPPAKGEVTVVCLFTPSAVPALGADLLKVKRDYSFTMPSKDLGRMVSGFVVTGKNGASESGAMLLFFTGNDSGVDLRQRGKYIFPIPIQRESLFLRQPAIEGEGYLTVAVFKEDDPKLDQIMSTSYVQLSEPVMKAVTLK